MGKKSMGYDHPAYLARYAQNIGCSATAAATAANKFVAFAGTRIKSIRGNINIAGTNTAACYDLYKGTASVGTLLCGTGAAGSVVAAITPAITLAENECIEFRTGATSATLAASFTVEYELAPAAQITA